MQESFDSLPPEIVNLIVSNFTQGLPSKNLIINLVCQHLGQFATPPKPSGFCSTPYDGYCSEFALEGQLPLLQMGSKP